jgi:hypothetical protein
MRVRKCVQREWCGDVIEALETRCSSKKKPLDLEQCSMTRKVDQDDVSFERDDRIPGGLAHTCAVELGSGMGV